VVKKYVQNQNFNVHPTTMVLYEFNNALNSYRF